MKTILTRLFTVMMLIMVSVAAGAQFVTVNIENNGKFDNGSITEKKDAQTKSADGNTVTVTLLVTPESGYSIDPSTIDVYETISPQTVYPNGTRANDVTLGKRLDVKCDVKTITKETECTVDVASNLGVWVQKVEFQKKREGEKATVPLYDDFSGYYYIANYTGDTGTSKGYNENTPQTNYYLCPAKPDPSAGDDYFYGAIYYDYDASISNQMPYLTTKRTGRENEALWKIEFAPTDDNSVDYYYIRYYSDSDNNKNKYLTHNTSRAAVTTRYTVHLQTENGGNNSMFCFETGADGSYFIRPRSVSSGNRHLNPATGNKNYYYGTGANSKKTTINETSVDPGGMIGYYTHATHNDDQASQWYLEKLSPVISYNSSNKIEISFIDASYTIYYSYGEESTPSQSSEGTFNYSETGPFDPPSGTTTIKAIAIKGDIESGVATFTPTFLLGSTHKYLIQSQSNVYFYMIPGDDEGEDPNKITKVNTTTLFRPTMEWYFKNAGVEDGVQYYYIVNRGNNKNLCYDTENTAYGVYMETNSDNSNKFKFQIVESPTAGTYNIIPYGVTADKKYLNKSSGNESAAAIILWSDATQGNNRWKFVPSADLDKTAPFNVSNTSSTPYYKIASVGSSGYYIVPPSGTATNVTTLNPTTLNPADPEVEKTMNWYFEVAQAATVTDWCTYYHIRNVLTDEYLYFAKDDNNADACLEMKSTIETGEEDRYMFTWARTATANTYYIVPKKVKDKSLNQISSLQRDNATLKSNLTRAVGNFAWTFAPSYCCLNPTIEYVPGAETGTVSMTCATKPSKIYYTTDGSNPASSTTRLVYDSEHKPSYTDIAQIYFKAIAVLDDSEHEAASEVITYIRNPKVTFDPEYDYEYNNSAKEPPVTSVAVVIDETTSISVEDTEYDVTYGANINVGSVTVTIGDAMDNNLFISGTATFNILPRSLGDGTTAADGILIAVTRTGEDTYTLTIKNGSLTLEENTDYSLSDVTADASGYRATITAVENSNYIGGAKVIYVKADFPTATGGNSGGPAAVYQASMDLAYPSDMKAYIVTGIDYSAAKVTVQELAYIPNGVPILLLTNDGSGHDADFTASAYTVVEEADVSANLLRKSEGGESVDWGQYFIFSRGEFVLSMGEKTMKAGKFYFDNDKYSSGGASTRALSIRCGTKDVASAINGVVSQSDKELKSPIWYTLEGQKLAQKPTRRGIYIQNGKIIIIK